MYVLCSISSGEGELEHMLFSILIHLLLHSITDFWIVKFLVNPHQIHQLYTLLHTTVLTYCRQDINNDVIIAVQHQQRRYGINSVIIYNGSLVIRTSPKVASISSALLMTYMKPRSVTCIMMY